MNRQFAFRRRRPSRRACRRAAMLVLVAVCLPLCIIMAAFAVDVAWMQLVRTELRTATDAAARAGAKELSLSQDTNAARRRAKEAASRNLVAGDPLLLRDSDIQIGSGAQASETSRFRFTPGGARPNAMRITGQRTRGSAAGPVDLLFAGVLGVRQFEPRETATSTHLDRDICLVVDRSGSMRESLTGGSDPSGYCDPPHPTRSRWGALAIAVNAFMDELERTTQQEHLALVSYSSQNTTCGFNYSTSQVHSDLVPDYSVIRRHMDGIGNRPVHGRTSISAGLDDGTGVLTGRRVRPFAVRTMILMTDGLHNFGREPILSAREAAREGLTIHTITFSNDADIRRMQDVAAATGGKHFHAPNATELVRIFKEIASTLPVLLTE